MAHDNPDAAPGLRELKKQRTAEAIRHAATTLFTAQGYEATTVEEIAATAQVSVSTFFRYFGTKEAVLLRTADGAAVVRDGLASSPAGESLWSGMCRSLLDGLPSLITVPDEEMERIRIAYTTPSVRGAIATAMSGMRQEIVEIIRPRLGRSRRARLEAEVLATALCGAIEITQDLFIASDAKGDPFALLADALAIYGAGLEHLGA